MLLRSEFRTTLFGLRSQKSKRWPAEVSVRGSGRPGSPRRHSVADLAGTRIDLVGNFINRRHPRLVCQRQAKKELCQNCGMQLALVCNDLHTALT